MKNGPSWFGLALVALIVAGGAVSATERPPRNPFLADSSYPLGHGDSAQQDALPVPGPDDPGPALDESEIQYAPVGPAQFGAYTSSPYPDGRRVIWSNGLDRIVKVDFETFEVLATRWIPGARRWTEAEADASIARFDESNQGIGAIWRAFRDASKLRDLSSVYTVLDADNTYYIADKSGSITAYGDADPTDPASPIVEKGTFQLPVPVTGLTVGMNMTFDGWLIVPTEHGYIVAVSRDFTEHRVVRLRHAEGAEEKATRPTGYGWVRNGVAIDDEGGLYVASQEHMHKVIWNGGQLSTDPALGAWTARYLNGWGHGTGATPSLMGFGDEDRFVVIADGEPLMNVVLFWRDEIPEDWEQLPDAPDPRIAGMLPANMGDPALREIQSEQSVVVAGYGALVVNNVPRNEPWYLPSRAATLLISYASPSSATRAIASISSVRVTTAGHSRRSNGATGAARSTPRSGGSATTRSSPARRSTRPDASTTALRGAASGSRRGRPRPRTSEIVRATAAWACCDYGNAWLTTPLSVQVSTSSTWNSIVRPERPAGRLRLSVTSPFASVRPVLTRRAPARSTVIPGHGARPGSVEPGSRPA
jgi:hypothetical protein